MAILKVKDELGNWIEIPAIKGDKGDQGDNTTAANVTNTPAGNIAATNVQSAINELDTEKASKTQEAWITPTLLNGAAHVDQNNPVQFFKDNFGIVHFRNKLTVGTPSNTQFVMPVGYRPIGSSAFFPLARVATATAFARADFSSSSGNVTTYETAGQNVDFSSVSYRAV